MPHDISPEEKLFNLIRSGSLRRLPLPDFRLSNRFLGVCLLAAVLLLVVIVLTGRNLSSARVLPDPSPLPPLISGEVPQEAVLSEAYQELVSARDIFQPFSSTASSASAARGLVLSGIYMGKHPQAIIEDQRADKVYFLMEGDELAGYTVIRISADKVILRRGTQELELL
jgi:type II secretory pathway component PulC